jgi:formiminotetrahydrofolate cyclodeaminase
VVAIHFFPLTNVLHNPRLPRLAWATLAVTVAALIVGLVTSVNPAVVTGAGGGVCLLGFALDSVAAALRTGSSPLF